MKKYILLLFYALMFFLPEQGAAQWKKITNLPSGYANNYWLDVFFLPSDPQYGWICGFNGQVLRTTNGGATWSGSQVSVNANLESIHFVSPTVGYTSGSAGLYKTTNGGATWVDISPINNGNLWGCYFVDANVGLVIGGGCALGDYQRFYRTADGGSTWSLYLDSVPNTGLTDLMLTSATGTGWAVSSGRLWQTNDGGVTWGITAVTGPNIWNEEITHVGSTFLIPVAGSSCGGGGGGGGMVFSNDNGAIWRDFVTGVPMFGTFLLSPSTGWACGDARSVYYTADGGQNWQLRNCGIEAGNLDDIWFTNETTGWVVGEGVYKFLWPPYELRPDTLKFGEVCIPGERTDTVFVINRSGLVAQASVSIGGADASQFQVVSTMPASVAGCDSTKVVVRFRPTSTGAKSAVGTVSLPGGNTLTFQLRGTGRLQSVKVVDTLSVISTAQVGVVTTGTIRWNNMGGMTETIIEAERLAGDSIITLMTGFPPLQVGVSGGYVYYYVVPRDTGWISARYRFRLSPCNNDTTVTIRVYGVSPIINAADSVLFDLNCRTELVRTIPVTNTGNVPLVIKSGTIGGTNPSDFTLLTPLPRTIAVGATDTLTVRFRPTTQGKRQAVLVLENNDSTQARGRKNPKNIALSGTFARAKFTTSFPTLDFHDVCVGDSVVLDAIVYGDPTAAGTMTQWRVNLSGIFGVVEPAAFPVSVPARAESVIRIRFAPTSAGSYLDTLRVSMIPCDSVLTFVLKGRGIQPAAVVLSTIASVTAKTDTDTPVSIGINNPTTEPETLILAEFLDGEPGISFADAPKLPLQLGSGKTMLSFTANVPDTGWFEARYRFTVKKGECSRDTLVTIRAYGVSPVLTTKEELYFALGTCNETAVDTVFVHNPGNDTLRIGALLGPTGPNAADFQLLGTARSKIVPPGDSLGLIIRFTPSQPGKRTAQITIEHNDFRSRAALAHPYILRLVGDRGFIVASASRSFIDYDTLCVGERRDLTVEIQNTGTAQARVVELLTTSQQWRVEAVGRTMPFPLGAEAVTLQISFVPSSPGLFRDTVIVHMLPCDELYRIAVEGFAAETKLQTTPATLNIGDIRTGVSTLKTVTVTSVGNVPAVLEPGSITLLPARDDLTIVSSPTLPTTLNPGESIELQVEFFPKTDTVFASQLCLSGDKECPFSLCLPVSARSVNSQLAIDGPRFGLIRCEGEIFDTVQVHNIGGESITINAVSIEPAGTPFLVVGPVSFVLQPGDVRSVVLKANPPADGTYSATLVLDTDKENKKEIDFSAEVRRIALQLQPSQVTFGTYERCAEMQELSVTVSNTGTLPDTVLVVRSASVEGFEVFPGDTLFVPASGSTTLTIRAYPGEFVASGQISETVLLRSTGCKEYALPLGIEIIESRLFAVPAIVTIGTVAFGERVDSIVRLTVTGQPRRVLTAVIEPAGTGFIVDTSLLPTVVNPGDSLRLPVHFTAIQAGSMAASLIIVHEGDCRDSTIVPLSALVPDDIFRVQMFIGEHFADPGDTIDIPVRYHGPLPRISMTSLTMTVGFDKWLLEPLAVTAAGGRNARFVYAFPADTMTITLDDALLSAEEFGADSTVLTIRALVLNSFPTTTVLSLDTVGITTQQPHILTYDNGLLSVSAFCEPVSRALRVLDPVVIQGITPHPAGEFIGLTVYSGSAQQVSLEVYDTSGKRWYAAPDAHLVPGESSVSIPTADMPDGVYFVRLTSMLSTSVVKCSVVK